MTDRIRSPRNIEFRNEVRQALIADMREHDGDPTHSVRSPLEAARNVRARNRVRAIERERIRLASTK